MISFFLVFLTTLSSNAFGGTLHYWCSGSYSDKYNFDRYSLEGKFDTNNDSKESNRIATAMLYTTNSGKKMVAVYINRATNGPSMEKDYERKSEHFAAWPLEDTNFAGDTRSVRVSHSNEPGLFTVHYDIETSCKFLLSDY